MADLSIFDLSAVLVERIVGDLGTAAAGLVSGLVESIGSDDLYAMDKEWSMPLCHGLTLTDFGSLGPAFTSCRVNVGVAWLGDRGPLGQPGWRGAGVPRYQLPYPAYACWYATGGVRYTIIGPPNEGTCWLSTTAPNVHNADACGGVPYADRHAAMKAAQQQHAEEVRKWL
jgi:hypothetical protein